MASNGRGIPDTVGCHARADVSLCHCEQSEAIKRHRILMILASYRVDCHEASASHNDPMSATKVASPKYFLVIASEAKQSNVLNA